MKNNKRLLWMVLLSLAQGIFSAHADDVSFYCLAPPARSEDDCFKKRIAAFDDCKILETHCGFSGGKFRPHNHNWEKDLSRYYCTVTSELCSPVNANGKCNPDSALYEIEADRASGVYAFKFCEKKVEPVKNLGLKNRSKNDTSKSDSSGVVKP